jgi:hypothetical protein
VEKFSTVAEDGQLREMVGVDRRGTYGAKGSAGVIKSLAAVRRRYDELMTRAAPAPDATLGQRLYTARRRANLTRPKPR